MARNQKVVVAIGLMTLLLVMICHCAASKKIGQKAPTGLPPVSASLADYGIVHRDYTVKTNKPVIDIYNYSLDILNKKGYSKNRVIDSAYNYVQWITNVKKDSLSNNYWTAKNILVELKKGSGTNYSITMNFRVMCAPVHDSEWTNCEDYNEKARTVDSDGFGVEGSAEGHNFSEQIERECNEQK